MVPPVPVGDSCVDVDDHTTSVGSGELEVTTEWYTRQSDGRRSVAMDGTMSIDGLGQFVATLQLRDRAGTVLTTQTWTFRRTDVWQAWWRDVSLPLHAGDVIASVRHTLRNATTGSISAARVSRPTD